MVDNSIRVILGQSEKEYQLLYDNNNIVKKKTLFYS